MAKNKTKKIIEKTIEIVAGPNGSGKTTFAESYFLRTKKNAIFLNPDLIASGIAPLDFERASFQAGRVLLSEVKSCIKRSESFSFESTLSGKTWTNILSQAKTDGYKIIIYFLFLNSIQTNIQRIQKRVKMGGHFVPSQTVRRRYSRCFINFWNLYRPFTHNWYVFNNSSKKPILVVSHTDFEALDSLQKEEFRSLFLQGKMRNLKRKNKPRLIQKAIQGFPKFVSQKERSYREKEKIIKTFMPMARKLSTMG